MSHASYDSGYREMALLFDPKDSFRVNHQICKIRRVERPVPEWVRSDKNVQDLLLRSFPGMFKNDRVYLRAARWAFIAIRFFRDGRSVTDIAYDLRGIKDEPTKDDIRRVKECVMRIRKAARGLPTDGRVARCRRPVKDLEPPSGQAPPQQLEMFQAPLV
jgi:hypothetical protein